MNTNRHKKPDYLNWFILLLILSFTIFISYNLSRLRSEIVENNTQKLKITDIKQFDGLCEQFKKQWNATDYIVYLYQPNSTQKTHKELATTSINNKFLPLRLEFSNSEMLRSNVVNYSNDLSKLPFEKDLNKNSKYYLTIPISSYNVVNAEIYIFFEKPMPKKSLLIYLSEAQILSKMIY